MVTRAMPIDETDTNKNHKQHNGGAFGARAVYKEGRVWGAGGGPSSETRGGVRETPHHLSPVLCPKCCNFFSPSGANPWKFFEF